jgi:hypothetical protein
MMMIVAGGIWPSCAENCFIMPWWGWIVFAAIALLAAAGEIHRRSK